MLNVTDTITNETKAYEDIDDFREEARGDFAESVWPQLDELCDKYAAGEYVGELEVFLGIEIH